MIASLLYLRYSKRKYLKFYRVFNRFAMKCFLHEALMFWGYSAPNNMIDNTNLARLRGTGKHAIIVPEMEAFARRYGFQFICHEIGHSNRKAGEERGFWTTETNFFCRAHVRQPGRSERPGFRVGDGADGAPPEQANRTDPRRGLRTRTPVPDEVTRPSSGALLCASND